MVAAPPRIRHIDVTTNSARKMTPPDPPTSWPTRICPITNELRRRGFTIDNTPVLVDRLRFSNDSTDILIPKAMLQQNTVRELTTK
jgi:hypothetical protein